MSTNSWQRLFARPRPANVNTMLAYIFANGDMNMPHGSLGTGQQTLWYLWQAVELAKRESKDYSLIDLYSSILNRLAR